MVALRLAAQDVVVRNDEAGVKVRILVLSDFDFAEELAAQYAKEGDGHAGTLETSRVMAIKPELIKAEGKAEVWRLPRFEVVAHPERFFPGGVNGDPAAASVEKGEEINRYIIEQLEKLVRNLDVKKGE
jgi:creatinine amidohydrolase